MHVTLELKPEVETRVTALARAAGVPLERYLQGVIEQATLSAGLPPISLDEQERLLDELAQELAHVPALPEETFTRDTIYSDHD